MNKFYGWRLVAAVWVILLINAALPFYGAGVMNAAMARFEGVDKSTLGLGFSVMALCAGLSSPLIALLIRRKGMRTTFVFGSLLIGTGAVLMATWVQQEWQFVAVFGVLVGLGAGFGGLMTAQSTVATWFSRRRATAIAIVMTATGVGGFLVPWLLNGVVGRSGSQWRRGWLIVAVLAAIASIIAWLFVKNSPAELNQVPDGIPVDSFSSEPSQSNIHRSAHNWSAVAAMHTVAFWFSALGAICVSCTFLTFVAHGIIHLQDFGHSPATGALALSLVALSSLPGRLGAGVLCDRFEPRFVWMAAMLCAAAGVFVVMQPTSMGRIYVFAVLLGIGYSGSLVSWAATLANYYGPVSYPSIFGVQAFANSLFTAVAPIAAGALYDRTGSYSAVFGTVASLLVSGAVLMFFARPPRAQAAAA